MALGIDEVMDIEKQKVLIAEVNGRIALSEAQFVDDLIDFAQLVRDMCDIWTEADDKVFDALHPGVVSVNK